MSEFRAAVNKKEYEFDAQALYNLLVHYTDGAVPLNGEVTGIAVHPQIQRKIALEVLSDEWESQEPLFLGYDGLRTMSWSKDTGGEVQWIQREETPRRQQ